MDALPLHLIAAHLTPRDMASLSCACKAANRLLPRDEQMYIVEQRLRQQHPKLLEIFATAKLTVELIANRSHVSLNGLVEFISFHRKTPRARYKSRAAELMKGLVKDNTDSESDDPTIHARSLRVLLCNVVNCIGADDPQLLCMRPWATLAFLQYVRSSLPHIRDSLTLGFILGVRHMCLDVLNNKSTYKTWLDRDNYKLLLEVVWVVLKEFVLVHVTMHIF